MSLRRKSFVAFAFGLPLLLGAVAVALMFIRRDAPAETEPVQRGTLTVHGYVDEAGLITNLPPEVPPDSLLPYPDEAAAQAALDIEEIEGYFIVPADYVASGQMTYVTLEYTPVGEPVDRSGLEYTLLVNLLGDEQLARAVWQPLDLQVTSLTAESGMDEDNWLIELFPMLMVLLIYMVVVLPAGMLVNAVTDEKKNRVMELLMASVSSGQFITGKILALGLLGLLQTAIWVGVFWTIARFGSRALSVPPGFTIPTSLIIWTLVYGLLGYAMYGVLLAGLGALVPDVKDARTASLVLMSPLIVPYILNMAIVERPDSALALLASLFPLTGPVAMIGRMAASAVPLWQALLSAALQFLTAALLLRMVARMFRAQQLLSGQPFTISRYFRLMLGRT